MEYLLHKTVLLLYFFGIVKLAYRKHLTPSKYFTLSHVKTA